MKRASLAGSLVEIDKDASGVGLLGEGYDEKEKKANCSEFGEKFHFFLSPCGC